MQRSIEGPARIWSSRKEAAAWLGITVSEFRREVEDFPDLLPPRPFGKSHKWFWMDLVVYSYLRHAGRCGPAPQGKNRA